MAADVPQFSTHTTRHHLCLTDLARMGWELHAIATFVGHRSTESTLTYIHLSGPGSCGEVESCDDAPACTAHQHAHHSRRDGVGATAAVRAVGEADATWPASTFPVSLEHYDRREELADAERRALRDLSSKALRRNRARGIPRRAATHWTALVRLVERSIPRGPGCIMAMTPGFGGPARTRPRSSCRTARTPAGPTGRERPRTGHSCAVRAPRPSSRPGNWLPRPRCAPSSSRWPICSAASTPSN